MVIFHSFLLNYQRVSHYSPKDSPICAALFCPHVLGLDFPPATVRPAGGGGTHRARDVGRGGPRPNSGDPGGTRVDGGNPQKIEEIGEMVLDKCGTPSGKHTKSELENGPVEIVDIAIYPLKI